MLQQNSMLEKSENAYRTIGEVSEILSIEQHILRFWETKFKHIAPQKKQGRRYYTKQDIKNLEQIKDLLYNQGYTIKGAQLHFSNSMQDSHSHKSNTTQLKTLLELLEDIEKTLIKI